MKFPKIQSNPQSQLKVGNRVSVIDIAEDTTEWAIFIIRDFFNNRYRLSPPNRHSTFDECLWVSKEEITKVTL